MNNTLYISRCLYNSNIVRKTLNRRNVMSLIKHNTIVLNRYSNCNIVRINRYSSNNSNNKRRQEYEKQQQSEHMKVAYYVSAIAVFIFGLSYASVPLYKVFCQMTGYGGTTQRADESTVVEPVKGARIIKVDFVANTHSTMPWTFKPTQSEVRIVPGETALAFYTVNNPTDKAILGVATYNVFPPKAGLYFSKIQCFCFEEQRLGPHEEIDMPVFFFIDPEIINDPAMESTTSITLSYTFFKTGEEEIDQDGEIKLINRDAKTEAYAKALIEKNKQNSDSNDKGLLNPDSNDKVKIDKEIEKKQQNIVNSYMTYILSFFKLN